MSFVTTLLSKMNVGEENKEPDGEEDEEEEEEFSEATSSTDGFIVVEPPDNVNNVDKSAISNFFGYCFFRKSGGGASKRIPIKGEQPTQNGIACGSQGGNATVLQESLARIPVNEPDDTNEMHPSPGTIRKSNVKPCGHGTIAVSPRIPINSTRVESPTPPGSPNFERAYKTRNNSDGCLLMVEKEKERKFSADLPRIDSGIIVNGFSNVDEMKNLVNQEAKFQSQLNDLTKQLSQRDGEASKLQFQMEELQRDVFAKTAGMDRLQAELQAAHKESEYVKQKLRNLENDLQENRKKNIELNEEIQEKSEKLSKHETETSGKISDLEKLIRELREKIEKLESKIEELMKEKQQLIEKHEVILAEKEKEKNLVAVALTEALKEKEKINKKWELEFEKMRTVSILKEQQVLDDFEWKLREVEKSCKNKLLDKDKSLDEKLKLAYKEAEEKMKLAQEMMKEVEHLKNASEEIKELKDQSKHQEKSIELLKEHQEQMKTVEQSLRDEAKKLRRLIDMEKENLQHMQRMHHQELVDKERWLQHTLDEKKTEIAVYWEERLLHEIGRLKYELEQLYIEEKHAALENVRRQKEEEFDEAKKNWEKKIEMCLKEISSLKNTLEEKEEFYHNEMIAQQTITDQDILELRRTMDKIDNAHHERFEKLVTEHEIELNKLEEEGEKLLKQKDLECEKRLEVLKASLEEAKVQMEKEAQQHIQELIQQHRSELDEQWANLVHQKSEGIRLVEQEYISKYKILEEQFYTQQKSHESREIELLKTIDSLKNDLESKTCTIDDLQSNVDTLEGGVQVLNNEIAHQAEQLLRNRRDADQKIRGLQDVLTKLQALQEQEREEFQSKLNQQQKQQQTTIDHLQRKCSTLSKLFEEVRGRYERRESRQEDLNIISDLRQVIAEQEKDLACLNEEKRFFQMQLLKLQRQINGEEEIEEGGTSEEDDEENYIVKIEEPDDDINGSFQIIPQRPPLNSSISIPPTIPECDDYDEE